MARFKPGQSGNPKGRPKGSKGAKGMAEGARIMGEYIRERTNNGQVLVDFYADVIEGRVKGMVGRDKLYAAKLLQEYSVGKPTEKHEIQGSEAIEELIAQSFLKGKGKADKP